MSNSYEPDPSDAPGDPAVTNADAYRIVFENDRVRVLEYQDEPGHQTTSHRHPDSVMVTLTSFRRRLIAGGNQVDVELPTGAVRWISAQEHAGHNIGDTATHSIFIELKEPGSPAVTSAETPLGPS